MSCGDARCADSRTRVSVSSLRIVGLFNPTIRELVELAYEFEQPFVVASDDIMALGARATPTAQALAETLDAYRDKANVTAHGVS